MRQTKKETVSINEVINQDVVNGESETIIRVNLSLLSYSRSDLVNRNFKDSEQGVFVIKSKFRTIHIKSAQVMDT